MLIVADVDTTDKEQAAREVCLFFDAAMPRARREVRSLPPLYQSGVRYASQDPKACALRNPKSVFERKSGDCKQLVLWRIAELREHGVNATPRIIWLAQKDELVAHAQVRLPDGSIEDPSYNLGMPPL